MKETTARYRVGQIVHHKIFHYRGIVVDVDPCFENTEEWYAIMAKTTPSKDQPWYHILVDNTDYITYVAEQNLELEEDLTPIHHPDLEKHFTVANDGSYEIKKSYN